MLIISLIPGVYYTIEGIISCFSDYDFMAWLAIGIIMIPISIISDYLAIISAKEISKKLSRIILGFLAAQPAILLFFWFTQ